MKLNTRIAPSPSGNFHLGTARTAYFNWLAARSTGGGFILRIDDTDVSRSNQTFIDVIYDSMNWLGLDYDLTFTQSSRFKVYKEMASILVEKKLAIESDGAITLILPKDQIPNDWYDEISKKIIISCNDKELIAKGIVLIKSDGSPTYHFASVIDDITCGINCVIRGTDHITNTSRQIAIYTALNKPVPKYYHIGLIHMNNKKLSKREGAASLLWYKDQGYDPDAMLNFMARLGWGPTLDDKSTALLPKDRMLELFWSGGHLRSNSANMDLVKLQSFDRKYKARKVPKNV